MDRHGPGRSGNAGSVTTSTLMHDRPSASHDRRTSLPDVNGSPRAITAVKAAAAAVAGLLAVRLLAEVARLLFRRPGSPDRHATAAVTVDTTPENAYSFWRDLSSLPTFMAHLDRVEVTGPAQSRWTARTPLGGHLSWDAEIVEDAPGRMLAWRSLPGSPIAANGMVLFRAAPGERGTEVLVDITYAMPFGSAGHLVAGLLGESPDEQVQDDLRRFKQVMETGTIVRSDSSPRGVLALDRALQQPAAPVAVPTGRS